MSFLGILFIVLALVSAACAVTGMLDKRRNTGFLITAVMIAIGDSFCFALLNADNAKEASYILLPYYILHAWFLFAFLLMITLIDRYRENLVPVVLSAGVCLYQTYLVISQYMGARVFSFQKRIYFRTAWWVATDTKNTGLLFSYRSYRIMVYINILLLLIACAVAIFNTHRIFRIRYVIFMVIVVAYSIMEGLTIHFALPVWIPCIAYNIIVILCLYLTCFFARSRLREWSLDSFANDMSDGLILYDKYDDLIHINDMVKETLEKDLLEAFEDRSRLDRWIEEGGRDDDRNIITYHVADRDYYLKVTIRKLGGHGKNIGTLYILHDTTDSVIRIKAMEEANAQLEHASRMKSDFLANMSHEIRTPMNAVIGMAEIAMRESTTPQMNSYLTQIQNSGRNLLNIINDILDYSKIESGRMEIFADEYEPRTELSDIADILNTRIGDKDIELYVTIEQYLPHKLIGDTMRIRQILLNIAGNAIKFTHSGMVRVNIRYETVSEDTVNMVCHVIDTGIGIKKEDLDKLFVSFQQVDSKRNRSVEGTGLGLAISERLAKTMGGSIDVTSEYGVGSDFRFTIPQKIADPDNDIAILNASGKFAYGINDKCVINNMFTEEMHNLGVECSLIGSIDAYSPSGKKDYLFIDRSMYDDAAKKLLDKYPDLTLVMLAGFDSDDVQDGHNVRIMRRPSTTMNMVYILNDTESDIRYRHEEKAYIAGFKAPEAKLLVVDDNAINLTIAEGLLEPLEVQIDEAKGGREAIEKVSANDYDIVLMDHMMPEIDGVEATQKIRAAGDSIHQPVIIAVSANVMEEARLLFKESGMNDFVAKPIDVRILTAAVKRWLPEGKIRELDKEDVRKPADSDTLKISCPGIDTKKALDALGSAALYDKIAGEYYKSGQDKLKAIMNAFNSKDWDDYTIRVHALKSSSRQIGAMKLGDMTEALEKAGKTGDVDRIISDNDAAMEEFKSILDQLGVYYAEETHDPDKTPMDSGTLRDILDELESGCDALDMDVMESVSDRLKSHTYPEDIEELVTELVGVIGEMDTDRCMELTDMLRGRLKL